MQVGDIRYRFGKLNKKEELMLAEIGLECIPTATEFVCYVSEKYEISQSGIWYTLKKLKSRGLVDFTEKGQQNRPLSLTKGGLSLLRSNVALPVVRQGYVRSGLNFNLEPNPSL